MADPGRRVGCGPRRPRLPASDQAGQAGVGSARRGRLRGGHGCRLPREVAAPAAWLASWGWVRDHGAWSSPSLPPGWAAGRAHWVCRRGWVCGPSAAQAGSERAQLAAGSALTCWVVWWACQDLNLGPHPYQGSAQGLFPQDCIGGLGERQATGDRWRPLRTARLRWRVDQTWTKPVTVGSPRPVDVSTRAYSTGDDSVLRQGDFAVGRDG